MREEEKSGLEGENQGHMGDNRRERLKVEGSAELKPNSQQMKGSGSPQH